MTKARKRPAPATAAPLPLAPPPDPAVPVTQQYLGFTETTWTTRSDCSASVWNHQIVRLDPDADGFEIEHEITHQISGGRGYRHHRVAVYRAGEKLGEWRPSEHEFTGHGCSPRLLAARLISKAKGE